MLLPHNNHLRWKLTRLRLGSKHFGFLSLFGYFAMVSVSTANSALPTPPIRLTFTHVRQLRNVR